jgi:biotin carboxyl carrier protein
MLARRSTVLLSRASLRLSAAAAPSLAARTLSTASPAAAAAPRRALALATATPALRRALHASAAARETVKVPQMAESITEGTLKQWNKKVGDFVEADEEIAVIETDKVRAGVRRGAEREAAAATWSAADGDLAAGGGSSVQISALQAAQLRLRHVARHWLLYSLSRATLDRRHRQRAAVGHHHRDARQRGGHCDGRPGSLQDGAWRCSCRGLFFGRREQEREQGGE